MNSFVYLFIAYLVIWVALFLYVYYLQRRQAEIKDDLEALSRIVDRKETETRDRAAEPATVRQ